MLDDLVSAAILAAILVACAWVIATNDDWQPVKEPVSETYPDGTTCYYVAEHEAWHCEQEK